MTMSLAHPSISERSAEPARRGAPQARIGPNAAIQLLRVLPVAADPQTVGRILAAAGALDWAIRAPAEMVDERKVAALHRATRAILPFRKARAVLTRAGALTGDYILANRIPVWARAALKALPARLSCLLLVRAIAANAWTFVGSGRFACDRTDGLQLEIGRTPCVLEKKAQNLPAFGTGRSSRGCSERWCRRGRMLWKRAAARGETPAAASPSMGSADEFRRRSRRVGRRSRPGNRARFQARRPSAWATSSSHLRVRRRQSGTHAAPAPSAREIPFGRPLDERMLHAPSAG